jgi:EpsI family protein
VNRSRRRAIALAASMGVTATLGLLARPRRAAAGGIDLQRAFPTRFAAWQEDRVAAAFVRAANELADQLYEQLLERTYIDPEGRRLMLSVAYGREQAAGLELHWPDVCYRYGGFSVHGKHLATVPTEGRQLPVTRLVAELPLRPEPVTYWSVLGGERVADANTFRLRRLSHAVRREVADGLLVRVSSIDPDADRAFALQARFIDEMIAAMAPADRARVAGIPPQG